MSTMLVKQLFKVTPAKCTAQQLTPETFYRMLRSVLQKVNGNDNAGRILDAWNQCCPQLARDGFSTKDLDAFIRIVENEINPKPIEETKKSQSNVKVMVMDLYRIIHDICTAAKETPTKLYEMLRALMSAKIVRAVDNVSAILERHNECVSALENQGFTIEEIERFRQIVANTTSEVQEIVKETQTEQNTMKEITKASVKDSLMQNQVLEMFRKLNTQEMDAESIWIAGYIAGSIFGKKE